jgi:hypothetical protein
MKFLDFPREFPPELITTMLAFTDLSSGMTLRQVDKNHKAIMDMPRTTLSTDKKALDAYKELFEEQAEYDYQNGKLSESKTGPWPWCVDTLTFRPFPLSFITHVFKHTIPGFEEMVNLQTARNAVCCSLHSTILKIKHHLPIMKLFGGRKGFEELPKLPQRTDTLAVSIKSMTAPIMRFSSDAFVIRMKNNSTGKYLIQPYLLARCGKWVTLESRETATAPIGRRAVETDRVSLTKEEFEEALTCDSSRDVVVITKSGEKTAEYNELHTLVIYKQITDKDLLFTVE